MVAVDVANMPSPAMGCYIVIRGTFGKVIVEWGDSNF